MKKMTIESKSAAVIQRNFFNALLCAGLFWAGSSPGQGGCGCCCDALEIKAGQGPLSAAEQQHLRYLREEEKLARDVYNAMHKRYGQRIFSNIPKAEQRHMDAVLQLLTAYGLDDPAKKKPGRFRNRELQKLYDELVKQGASSREEAFLAGALIEETDILDLQTAIRQTDKEQIRSVLEMLLGGSQRHLNAFVRNYEAVSEKPYSAQRMKQAEVDRILGR